MDMTSHLQAVLKVGISICGSDQNCPKYGKCFAPCGHYFLGILSTFGKGFQWDFLQESIILLSA